MAKKIKTTKTTNDSILNGEYGVRNGLSDVVMGSVQNPFGSNQLSQTDTIFMNNRWYMISNQRAALSQSYVEHGLIQTLIDTPVDDGLKGGITITSEQLSPDEIKSLQVVIEHEGILETLGQALKWTRLYGGGGVLIMTNQDHSMKLNLTQNELKNMEFRDVDMWELFATQQNIDDDTRRLELKSEKGNFCYDYYGIPVHKSRVLDIKGLKAPSFIRPRLRGWGFSVVESLVQSINQFFKAKNLTFEVMDEFKLDIYKIKGFTAALMTKDGTAKAVQRVTLANQQKNFQNAITMDSDDDHISKQLNFSGIHDVMKEIRMQIASDMRMPMSKLFGISATGFSSGEDDIEVYNSMVEGQVRYKAKKPLLEMLKILCMRDFGFIPTDLGFAFKPMRMLSSEQEENVKTAKCNRIIALSGAGLCDSVEAKSAINKDDILGVKVDVDKDTMLTTDIPEGGGDPAAVIPSKDMIKDKTVPKLAKKV